MVCSKTAKSRHSEEGEEPRRGCSLSSTFDLEHRDAGDLLVQLLPRSGSEDLPTVSFLYLGGKREKMFLFLVSTTEHYKNCNREFTRHVLWFIKKTRPSVWVRSSHPGCNETFVAIILF